MRGQKDNRISTKPASAILGRFIQRKGKPKVKNMKKINVTNLRVQCYHSPIPRRRPSIELKLKKI